MSCVKSCPAKPSTQHEYGQILYERIKMTHPRTAAELADASYEYEDIAGITIGQDVHLASGYSDSESICDYDSRPEQRKVWCRLTPYFYRREDCEHQLPAGTRRYRRIVEPELQQRHGKAKGGDLM